MEGSHWVIEAFNAVESRSRATFLRYLEKYKQRVSVSTTKWLKRSDMEFNRKTELVAAGDKFFQSFQIQKRVVIIGGVHIAQALVKGLSALDFEIVIIDPRTIWANKERFPNTKVINSWPEEALSEIQIDQDTALVALTHDPKFDDPAIAISLRSRAFYVGALGGSKSAVSRRARLTNIGLTDIEIDRLHSPIGLSIGAKGPAEISVAIMAELIQSYRTI